MRQYISDEACNLAVRALVISRLDYCNGLLVGVTEWLCDMMQRIQNRAALLVARPRVTRGQILHVGLHHASFAAASLAPCQATCYLQTLPACIQVPAWDCTPTSHRTVVSLHQGPTLYITVARLLFVTTTIMASHGLPPCRI